MASVVVNNAKALLLNGGLDLDTDTIKCALLTSSYSPNIDTNVYWSDISANEVSGTGYSAGGAALSGKSVTVDNTGDKGVFDASDVTWGSSTITARFAALYKDTGVAGTSPIVCVFDFSTDKSSSSGNFIIQWNASGILTLS